MAECSVFAFFLSQIRILLNVYAHSCVNGMIQIACYLKKVFCNVYRTDTFISNIYLKILIINSIHLWGRGAEIKEKSVTGGYEFTCF